MRNKIWFLTASLAAVICLCGFSVTAFAYTEETSEETAITETPEETAAEEESNPFTPDGTGTVLDTATDGDGKQFYTITTPAGNVFYLIIDLERDSNNVYFLDAVTEKDLLALAEQAEDTDSAANSTAVTTPAATDPVTEETADATDTQTETASDSGGSGSLVFILIAVVAAGGVGFYFKIYKPKQQAALEEELDEEYEDGDGFDDYSDADEETEAYASYPLEEDIAYLDGGVPGDSDSEE